MLKEKSWLFTRLTVVADLVLVAAAFLLAYRLRGSGELPASRTHSLWILLVILPVWYVLLSRSRFYASIRLRTLSHMLLTLVQVHLVGGVLVGSAVYFLDRGSASRSLVGLFLVLSLGILGAAKVVQKGVLGSVRRRGFNFRHILVLGTGEKASGFVDLVDAHAEWGLRVVGIVRVGDEEPVTQVGGHEVLGTLDEVVGICAQYAVDEVAFCVSTRFLEAADAYLTTLEEMGITVRMVLDVFDRSRKRKELSWFHETIPIAGFATEGGSVGRMVLKRCLDVAGAAVGLLATAVAFPFVATAIRIDSPGPVFFSQNRVGENGRIFRCRKFRSMYADAESRKPELLPQNEMNGAAFKMKDDPRITRVGRFLRRTSLDEFPQFWNVLRGEMSLVGTRPPTPDEVERYDLWHHKRICIRPGLTGLWQVSGRSRVTDFDEIARLDIQYIDTWSLWLDLKILFKTFQVILSGHGSY